MWGGGVGGVGGGGGGGAVGFYCPEAFSTADTRLFHSSYRMGPTYLSR